MPCHGNGGPISRIPALYGWNWCVLFTPRSLSGAGDSTALRCRHFYLFPAAAALLLVVAVQRAVPGGGSCRAAFWLRYGFPWCLRCERGDGPVLCRLWPGWLVDRRRRRRLVFGTWEWKWNGTGVCFTGLDCAGSSLSVPTSCDPTVTVLARWFLQEAYQFGISFLSALSAGIGGATRSLPIKCRCGACRKASSAEVVGLAQSYARSASRILTTSYLSACRYSRPGLSLSFHFASRKVIAASMSRRGRVASLPRRQSSPEKPVMSSGCLRGTAESAQHGYD
jgi:hypothetical protein